MWTAEVEAGHATCRRAGLTLEAKANHEIRPECVGDSGTFGVGGIAVRWPGQECFHADRGHPALKPAGQIPQDVCFADRTLGTVHDQPTIIPAAAGIDDDPLSRESRAGYPNVFFLADGVQ